jgi:hypothetical protein
LSPKKILFLTITIVLFLASVNTDVVTIKIPLAFAANAQKFVAKLTGQNEVPPTDTIATGAITMELSPDGTISHYVLNVTNIGNVRSAQIHEGTNNTKGPVIFTFQKIVSNRSRISGTLSEGTVYSNNFEGPFAGKHLSDLIILIDAGKAFVNINTQQHPLGEIRGQLSNLTPTRTVPEFGDGTATVIFVIALVGIIVVSTKYNNVIKRV